MGIVVLLAGKIEETEMFPILLLLNSLLNNPVGRRTWKTRRRNIIGARKLGKGK